MFKKMMIYLTIITSITITLSISNISCSKQQESPEELRQRLLNDASEKYFTYYDIKTHQGENQFLVGGDMPKTYFKIIYGPKRNVVRVEKYANEKPNGYWLYYNRDGVIVKIDYYSMGELTQSIKNPY